MITAGQQARSILPLQAFLYAERASEFPRPYVKYSVEPARAEDVPAAIARAYYVAMQPPCGPTFVSVPIDDWTHPTQPVEARQVSRELGPDPDAMKALVAALSESKRPALVVGPGVDRAAGRRADGAGRGEERRPRSGSARFRRAARFPERHPQFAGFLHASPGQLSDALRDHDLVVVIGAPVFTFHVEGHASIFDGATTIFQITDDPTAAAVTPVGTSIIATMKPALSMLLELLPETKRATPAGRTLPPAPAGVRSAPRRIPAAFALHGDAGQTPCWSRKRHRIGRRCRNSCRCAGRTVFTPWRAAASATACRPRSAWRWDVRGARTVCLIGDGSAMYSIQALWTAAQRKLPLTVVVINNSGYGAMRSFSQVMQVRNVPGLELPGIDFVKIARRHGLRRRAGDEIIRTRGRAQARAVA